MLSQVYFRFSDIMTYLHLPICGFCTRMFIFVPGRHEIHALLFFEPKTKTCVCVCVTDFWQVLFSLSDVYHTSNEFGGWLLSASRVSSLGKFLSLLTNKKRIHGIHGFHAFHGLPGVPCNPWISQIPCHEAHGLHGCHRFHGTPCINSKASMDILDSMEPWIPWTPWISRDSRVHGVRRLHECHGFHRFHMIPGDFMDSMESTDIHGFHGCHGFNGLHGFPGIPGIWSNNDFFWSNNDFFWSLGTQYWFFLVAIMIFSGRWEKIMIFLSGN